MTNHDVYPLTSFHWGTYRVETRDDEVVALHPFEEDPDPSPIGQGYVGVLNGPDRITAPMVRKSWLEGGPGTAGALRGTDDFVEVGSQGKVDIVKACRRKNVPHSRFPRQSESAGGIVVLARLHSGKLRRAAHRELVPLVFFWRTPHRK